MSLACLLCSSVRICPRTQGRPGLPGSHHRLSMCAPMSAVGQTWFLQVPSVISPSHNGTGWGCTAPFQWQISATPDARVQGNRPLNDLVCPPTPQQMGRNASQEARGVGSPALQTGPRKKPHLSNPTRRRRQASALTRRRRRQGLPPCKSPWNAKGSKGSPKRDPLFAW